MHPTLAKSEATLIQRLLHPGEGRQAGDDTRRAARLAVLDAVAVGLGTRDHPAAVTARRHVDTYLAHGDDVGVWGSGKSSSLEGAILANTVPLRCFDFNDVLHGRSGQGGHPSDVIPGLMAVAEWQQASGRALVEAVITTFDAIKFLFDNLKVSGWDYTNLTGLGAVAGIAALMGLDDEQGGNALGIFATSHLSTDQLESGDLSSSGNLTMWKRFNGAEAVMGALRACQLASSGVEAPTNSLLGDDGFVRRQGLDPQQLADAANDRQTSEEHGVDVTEYKRWPVGTRAQSAIDAAIEGRAQVKSVLDLDRVEVEVDDGVVEHLVREEAWHPYSRETADHSLPFAVALALLEGEVSIDHYSSDEFFKSPDVATLLSKIKVNGRPNPTTRSSYRTRITLVDGEQEHVTEAEYPAEAIRASTFADELQRKFDAHMTKRFSADHAEKIRATIDGLDELPDVRVLGELLSAAAS